MRVEGGGPAHALCRTEQRAWCLAERPALSSLSLSLLSPSSLPVSLSLSLALALSLPPTTTRPR